MNNCGQEVLAHKRLVFVDGLNEPAKRLEPIVPRHVGEDELGRRVAFERAAEQGPQLLADNLWRSAVEDAVVVGGTRYLSGLGLAPREELVKLGRAPREVVAKVVESSGRILRDVGVLAVQQVLLVVEPPRALASGSCLAVDLVPLCALGGLGGKDLPGPTRGESRSKVCAEARWLWGCLWSGAVEARVEVADD